MNRRCDMVLYLNGGSWQQDNKVCKQGEENIRKQLAAAVRSIQWSYAIFWSPSSKESGVVLQWGDGYYNGDIKTRRTVLSMDSKADDETGSRRSDQLRELYDSLLSGNNNIKNNQTRRPLAALSPEDLTNVEWFYLICMSFVFNTGQGLPGKSLASGRTIWLSNAHRVDTGVFSRSLLAKSAGIKTVVCIPLLGGVVELGITELVEEDLNVIQLVGAAFLENSSAPPDAAVGLSPSGSSNGTELIQPPLSDVLLFQAQSWRGGVMEDDQLSNCVLTSTMNSSDCISQSVVVHSECALITPPKIEREPYDNCDDPPISDDLHYQNVLSSIFKESNDQRVLGSSSGDNLYKKSSFRSWIKGGTETEKPEFCVIVTPQKMLKKMLFEIPQMMIMHSAAAAALSIDQSKDELLCKQQEIIPNTNHVLAERRRREKVNERFSTLRSLILSITKADKISILDDTIAYLKELERRVVGLESGQESSARETKKKRKEIDIEERTSDNYGDEISVGGVKNKRKTREVEDQEEGREGGKLSSRDSLVVDNTITVSMAEEEILIDISCRWRENLLIQIIDAMSNLHLDSQSVHSSTVDGVLTLRVQSKVKGSTSVSIGMITQSLQRVLRNS